MVLDFFATLDVNTDIPRWMPANASYLLTASSFYRKGFRTPRIPEGCTAAADWGGFVVQKRWGGECRFTDEQYVDWLRRIPNLQWASLWDLPCEPELASGDGEVRRRQIWTHDRAVEFVEEYADESWAWAPTVQGYNLDDYKRSCDDMAPIIEELQDWYELLTLDDDDDLWACQTNGEPCFPADTEDELPLHRPACNPWSDTLRGFRVGIGSVCARKNVEDIWAIVDYVTERFPGVPLHLWGVKLAALKDWPGGIPDAVVSTDSAAWNGRFGTDISRFNADQKRLGYSQAQYGLTVRLPYYLERFAAITGQA